MTVHSVDFVILTCTVFDTVAECNRRTDRQIDRQTDAQAIAKTREAFCCRAKKTSPYQSAGWSKNLQLCTKSQRKMLSALQKY